MINKNDKLVAMKEKKHSKELDFQNLIKKHPDLIPGDQIDSENHRRWLFIGEEVHFPTLGGGDLRLDLLFLDQDGIPTLVELKRSKNIELNRDVAAQIMEYGANILLSMDTRSLRKMLEDNDEISLSAFLGIDESEEEEIEEFWEKVYDNLKSEKIRLLVIADEIPNRIQNILEFLNRNMESVEILAVEIKQYTKDDDKTLVPRVIGQSIEAQTKKSRRTGGEPLLDTKTFFEKLDPIGNEFFLKLFKFIKKEQLKVNWGTKGFSCNISINGKNISIFRGYSELAKHGQRVESTSYDIIGKVKDGNEIAEKYKKEIINIEGFDESGDGFIFKIEKNLDDQNWKQLEHTISSITFQIKENGLS